MQFAPICKKDSLVTVQNNMANAQNFELDIRLVINKTLDDGSSKVMTIWSNKLKKNNIRKLLNVLINITIRK